MQTLLAANYIISRQVLYSIGQTAPRFLPAVALSKVECLRLSSESASIIVQGDGYFPPPFRFWFFFRPMKTLLIGQPVTREKYERTTGSWREKERAYRGKLGRKRALESTLSRGDAVYRAAAMRETPKKTCNTNVKICRYCNSPPLISMIV